MCWWCNELVLLVLQSGVQNDLLGGWVVPLQATGFAYVAARSITHLHITQHGPSPGHRESTPRHARSSQSGKERHSATGGLPWLCSLPKIPYVHADQGDFGICSGQLQSRNPSGLPKMKDGRRVPAPARKGVRWCLRNRKDHAMPCQVEGSQDPRYLEGNLV